MKEKLTLKAEERSEKGKGFARKIRAAGSCPAVLYGPGADNRHLKIDPRELQKLLSAAGESSLIDLQVSGSGKSPSHTEKVIIRDLQYRPLSDVPYHVDFYRVSMDRTISISVPIEITGTCEACENKTGTFSVHTHELLIECLPNDIPSKIEADISGLTIGGSLHVKDLQLPAGVAVTASTDLAIVSINAVKEEEEVEEVAPELETAEPEVIGQEEPQKEAQE